ncbi:MAG: DM13 domain-containing protein [Acidimicrobiales bacterium]|nr:DM13 domain-containing protein [Acidimicrobiales bacterium]
MKRTRLLWAVPVVVLMATFGVFGVRHPASVRAMLMNPQGLVMIGAALVAAAIFVWASRFRPKIQPFVPLVIAAGILGAAVYAEVPFERSSTQNEMLVAEAVVDATTTTTTTTASAVATSTTAPASESTTSPPRVRSTATRHASAGLRGIDHSASGTVSIVESSSGKWVVRFEAFDVQFTPAPVLYVVQEADAEDPGGTNLGAFSATDGDLLDVALPDGVEPGPGWTVLIWCDKFDTPIAHAALR